MPRSPIGLIAVGKAAGPMALAARQVLGAAIDTALVISPDKVDVVPPFQNIVAGHPVPNTPEHRSRRARAGAGASTSGGGNTPGPAFRRCVGSARRSRRGPDARRQGADDQHTAPNPVPTSSHSTPCESTCRR